jgi:predicted DNA-binding ribbon-helix-helix protein
MQHLVKRSISIAGHRTSVALEPEFWAALDSLAAARGETPARVVARLDAAKAGGLASALRVYVLREVSAAEKKIGPSGASPKRPKFGEKP